ncbi:DUF6192 family protein [Streptomyces inhibens]|uniref:DUF6192 family protein n=1 Tax=Streptomyces inhibens TaxID=2293571 RepID=UPI001EE72CE7|nr:DUF6192 family protein [Streptomyces inhibens]UKY55556.1 DUF6192 family protein [Streptomyces inhibens]
MGLAPLFFLARGIRRCRLSPRSKIIEPTRSRGGAVEHIAVRTVVCRSDCGRRRRTARGRLGCTSTSDDVPFNRRTGQRCWTPDTAKRLVGQRVECRPVTVENRTKAVTPHRNRWRAIPSCYGSRTRRPCGCCPAVRSNSSVVPRETLKCRQPPPSKHLLGECPTFRGGSGPVICRTAGKLSVRLTTHRPFAVAEFGGAISGVLLAGSHVEGCLASWAGVWD